MPRSSRPFRLLGALAAVIAAAGCRSTNIDVPAFVADTTEADVPLVDLPPSYVSAPIAFDLRPVLAELEAELPRKFGSLERDKAFKVKLNNAPDLEIAPEISRGPLDLEFKDNTITISGVLSYKARVWTKVVLVTTSVSCGTGDYVPRIRFKAKVSYDVTESWHLRTRSELVSLEPFSQEERDQCEVTAAKINATGLVADKAGDALGGMLTRVDQRLAQVSLTGLVGGVWGTLQRPISISKGLLWLQIQPQAVSLGSITAADSTLTVRLDLLASPRMVTGDRPPDGMLPLPRLGRTAATADTALMAVHGQLLYSVATDMLRKKLTGKALTRFGGTRFKDVTMASAGRGRVVLGITVGGRLNGTFYVVGTPQYDAATDVVSLPDVAFDVQSQGSLEQFAGWLVNGPLLRTVRDAARFSGTELLSQAIEIANREINRELSDGINLRGELSGARPVNVVAGRDGLVAQAQATGRLWLEISKTDLIPGRSRAVARTGP